MKYLVIGIILSVAHHSTGNVIPNKLGECSRVGTFCSSCQDVAMCLETDYGTMKQTAYSCPSNQSCHNGKCVDYNPFCDGTADIPFQCHVPGAYPDPFDCQAYHYCVVVGHNDTDLILEDFKHECQDDEHGMNNWAYDARTNFCSEPFPLDQGCRKWPVPPCFKEGQTAPLEENHSIYFVCQNVQGKLYPQFYTCPHGSKYDPYYRRCGVEDEPTTGMPSSDGGFTTDTSPYTTGYPYTTTNTSYTTGYPYTTTDTPSYTTGYPYTTTDTPSYTTGYPYTTTDTPSYTTGYPYTTTDTPSYTTGYPYTTTDTPSYTTGYPYTTTDTPSYTTGYPYTTTDTSYTTGYPYTTTDSYGTYRSAE